MICAGCDGPMTITKDAIGRERIRCKRCHGVSEVRRNPNDAMIPQGLVRANLSVRVIREIVKVREPIAEPIRVVELPAIRPGQLRCQLCAVGVDPSCRFCDVCSREGHRQLTALRTRQADNRGANAGLYYLPKPCARCGTEFRPTGPRSKYCEACR
jgi:hypothetical protein